jgi:hypothetical protein
MPLDSTEISHPTVTPSIEDHGKTHPLSLNFPVNSVADLPNLALANIIAVASLTSPSHTSPLITFLIPNSS